MRKLLCVWIALMLVFTVAAAESAPETQAPAMVELNFIDFTLLIPEDIIGTVEQEMVNGSPFFVFFEDYDPNAAFNKNLNGVWTEELLDIEAVDPTQFVSMTIATVAQQYESIGIAATDPMLYMAGLDEHDGKQALSQVYSLNLDYTGVGFDLQKTIYTMQAIVPIEGVGTYTFTITTDDMENIPVLMGVMESIRWID